MSKRKCPNYDEKQCAKSCTQDWVRCKICGDYLIGPFDEINSYVIDSAETDCQFVEHLDKEAVICPSCYESRVKPLYGAGKPNRGEVS